MATDEQKRYEMSLDPIEKMLNDELLEKWELLSFPYFLPNLFGDFPLSFYVPPSSFYVRAQGFLLFGNLKSTVL